MLGIDPLKTGMQQNPYGFSTTFYGGFYINIHPWKQVFSLRGSSLGNLFGCKSSQKKISFKLLNSFTYV